jgi:hypothetical protein
VTGWLGATTCDLLVWVEKSPGSWGLRPPSAVVVTHSLYGAIAKVASLKKSVFPAGCSRRASARISDLSFRCGRNMEKYVHARALRRSIPATPSLHGRHMRGSTVGIRHPKNHYRTRRLLNTGGHGEHPARGCGHQTHQTTRHGKPDPRLRPPSTPTHLRNQAPKCRIPTSDSHTEDTRLSGIV